MSLKPIFTSLLQQLLSRTMKVLVVKSLLLIAGLTVSVAAHSEIDLVARPSLTAEQHYKIAKEIADIKDENPRPELYAAAVFHIEQAIKKGYSDRKSARFFLQEQLMFFAASGACDLNVANNCNNLALSESCKALAAKKRECSSYSSARARHQDDRGSVS